MMNFAIMGDSISSFKGAVPDGYDAHYPFEESGVKSEDEMWWSLLAKKTGGAMVCADAYSGSRVSETGNLPVWTAFISDRRIANVAHSNADAVVVLGGTNDFGQRENGAVPTLTVFEDAYKTLVKKLRAALPRARLYFCVPLSRTDWGRDEKNVSGWTWAMLHESVRRMVGEAQKSDGGIFLIDLSALDPSRVLYDGLHPSKAGMAEIAGCMAAQLR